VAAPNKGKSLRITSGTSLDSEEYWLNSDDRLLHSDEGSEKSVDDCVSTTQCVSDMT